ncbi:hypothetical protein LDZ77_00795 [Bacteroides xylanisolvens]|uniref:Acyltransferase n=1 Tax=Bacteroides xylanisolvens TaxID=371601 RepID=A0AAW4SQZ8_9BACE|nr:hypothetical protein [Bacteroides xylanisolvens]MCA4548958.1 hypothetical protein [Bacteroides xylanisolvens]MCA4562456.1 hypothetical protein [Bacteroides xylanisolvens]MCA4567542.1 hypothetical protein [Bacteroides xylanisolvens]MCA4598017.1 hypothetical protein [Bacteroides xylanisolvens]
MGKNRNVRIDGAVEIGERCYIGARSVICSRVIADAIVIGANTIVSKSLNNWGFMLIKHYVIYLLMLMNLSKN